MDESTLRAMFVNTVLVANADGRVAPEQRVFLQRFAKRANITPAQMKAWVAEIRAGKADFQALDSPEHREVLFALMIGTASSDGTLSDGERDALLDWGRVLGLSPETVRKRAQTLWSEDVLATLFPGQAAVKPASASPRLLIITDNFASIGGMLAASPEIPVSLQPMTNLPAAADAPSVIVFHAHEEKAQTLNLLADLRQRLPGRAVLVVLDRHQAFQISYLYDANVERCLVEPVYPGELARVLDELDSPS